MPSLIAALPRLLLGFLLATCIGLLAWRRGSLAPSGVLGAILTGTCLFGFGGFTAGCMLIAFFASSSALSHYKQRDARKARAARAFDKGGKRDLGQALANAGVASLLAVGYWWNEDTNTPAAFTSYAGMMAALATANADTWATELGVLSKSPPRLVIAPWRTLPAGASGGISALGLAAALAGAFFVALVFGVFTFVDGMMVGVATEQPTFGALYFSPLHLNWAGLAIGGIGLFMLIATLCGWLGALADSVLGATLQRMYRNPASGALTERAREPDGSPNMRVRGLPFLNNDWVNFVATAMGAVIAMLIFRPLAF